MASGFNIFEMCIRDSAWIGKEAVIGITLNSAATGTANIMVGGKTYTCLLYTSETKADVDRVEEACRAMNQKEAIEKAFDSID